MIEGKIGFESSIPERRDAYGFAAVHDQINRELTRQEKIRSMDPRNEMTPPSWAPTSNPTLPNELLGIPTLPPPRALDVQIGGDHYKTMAIQPMEFSMANKLDACQHTIIKYVTRFRSKGGRADLEKARHVIDMLIELEYGQRT